MNINFNPSFSGRKNKQRSNFALATGLTAVLAASPAAINAQNTQNKKEIITEFQMTDKDNSYKLSTIEFLDCIASKYQNPKEQMKQLEIGLKKFAAADQNMDGELNIDEFTALKENKIQFKNNGNVLLAPIQDKEKRKKEANEIMLDIDRLGTVFYSTNENKVKAANDALNRINSFNIVEIAENFDNCKLLNTFLENKYHRNNEAKIDKIDELYSLMGKRAKDSGCLNRYKEEILSKKFNIDRTSQKQNKYISSKYEKLVLLYTAARLVSQTEKH